jgi:tRNA(Ile)-lysidine synthase
MDAVLQSVQAALLRHTQPEDTLCVGLSGGLDSVVLLHSLVALREAANIRNPLSALHVHHGLSPNADSWATFCTDLCAAWRVPIQIERVAVNRAGAGLEAAARDARYAAYARSPARWMLQAHHADDQVGTLLLRLSRGTGLRGLAGMPEVRSIAGGKQLLRPLLSLGRPQLADHARLNGLRWIEDESNADPQLDRNFLRMHVVPPLAERFPAWRANWSRAARHASDALVLLDELAQQDAGDTADLRLDRLRALSSRRLHNVLRWWVAQRGEALPDTARLQDVERCLRECGPEAHLGIRFGRSAMFHYRGQLLWAPASRMQAPATFSLQLKLGQAERNAAGGWTFEVPELGGVLELVESPGEGIAMRHLHAAGLKLHGAQPGGAMRISQKRPQRSLKNLWQEAAVPPWERPWQPQLSVGDRLAWVAGLGVDASLAAAGGELGVLPSWRCSR